MISAFSRFFLGWSFHYHDPEVISNGTMIGFLLNLGVNISRPPFFGESLPTQLANCSTNQPNPPPLNSGYPPVRRMHLQRTLSRSLLQVVGLRLGGGDGASPKSDVFQIV